MLNFQSLEAKGTNIPNVVKKLYNDITPSDNLDTITSKAGLTPENCKNALRFLTDVEKAVRQSQRVAPPPGGYKALRMLQNVFKQGETASNIGYTLSHNKRKIVLLAVGATVGVITGGLGLVVLAAGTLGSYAASSAWRRWGHIILARKGSMDFDPNSAEDWAKIEEHITTWQDRIVRRQLDGLLQKMHFEQRCWDAMDVTLLYSGNDRPFTSCAQWVSALEGVCRVRKTVEEVHTGFKDIVHFWGLLTYELVDRQQKFGAKLPQILGTINGQIQKSSHNCSFGNTWFGDVSVSRRLSGGVCYEWKPSGSGHQGGPIYAKHAINTGVAWETRLRSDRTSLFMKLVQDATTWGGLIESGFTGGSSQLPGRYQTRLARSVDMFSGGKPDKADEIKDLYPMLFTKRGETWVLNGAPPPGPPTTPSGTGTAPLPATGSAIALTSLQQTAQTAAITSATRTLGGTAGGLVSGSNIGESISTAFNPAAVTTPTNLFTNVVGSSATHAVTSGAGYATAGLGVVLEVLNFVDNSSLVNKGRHLIGTDATVSELVTAHAGVLKDHFGAIAWAWKAFRKADDALMSLGGLANCT